LSKSDFHMEILSAVGTTNIVAPEFIPGLKAGTKSQISPYGRPKISMEESNRTGHD